MVLLRHTLTTRLLYTVLPSDRYAPDGQSLQTLLADLTINLLELERSGLEVTGKQS